ncbi:MAG: alpha/beta hydrolase [Burkholderiales bacterium]|nr:alpha/beta hydrolase [Burkholderiales bacterium]MDE1927594.1 alpha/beta hydrolase [Burkholderiales bacterium]MDE2161255.1 alpha/beta hydrolase [Burkholderiales bacterium]MDE2505176.1 alpha/beta hydrolase [Burkholderiales bacterium]
MSAPRPRPLRRHALALILLASAAALLWIASHALADDARPAVGERHTVPGQPPVTYYLLDPPAPTARTETVVLVASLGRPVSDFNALRRALAQAGYRSIAVESRGIRTWAGGGFSNYRLSDLAGDIHAAIADAGLPTTARVHLIGHAFGNRVARTFATLYPQQTAALVLIAAGDKTDAMPADVARSLRLSTLGFLPWALRGGAVSRVFFAAGHAVPDAWRHGWSSWGAIGQVRAARAAHNQDFDAGGVGPMLVLQGEEDVVAPPRDAGELLKANYGARVTLVPVPQAGHALLPEQGDLIARAVVTFLRAHPAAD